MNAKKILNNIYVRNLLLACFILVVLIFLTLRWLDQYTRHGESVEIPNVKGLTLDKAQPFFQNNHLNFQVVDSVFNRNATPGTIVETIPPVGTKVKEGKTIYITLNSFSSQLLVVPDVKDYSQRRATATLKSIGFENVQAKAVPGAYLGLVVGLESKGVPLEAGKRVPVTTPLTLLVGSGVEAEPLFPNDSIIVNDTTSDESWF